MYIGIMENKMETTIRKENGSYYNIRVFNPSVPLGSSRAPVFRNTHVQGEDHDLDMLRCSLSSALSGRAREKGKAPKVLSLHQFLVSHAPKYPIVALVLGIGIWDYIGFGPSTGLLIPSKLHELSIL